MISTLTLNEWDFVLLILFSGHRKRADLVLSSAQIKCVSLSYGRSLLKIITQPRELAVTEAE